MNEIETLFCTNFINYVSKLKSFETTKIQKEKVILSKNYLKTNKKAMFDYDFWFHLSSRKETLQQYCYYFCNAELCGFEINGYQPDFMIIEPDFHFNYAIEIDGHEWHEKTKEQARRDKQKDRAYLKSGYIPIHFTGSEIYHDVIGCVKETLEIMCTYPDDIKNSANSRVQEIVDERKTFLSWYRNVVQGFGTVKAIQFDNEKLILKKNVTETYNKKYVRM